MCMPRLKICSIGQIFYFVDNNNISNFFPAWLILPAESDVSANPSANFSYNRRKYVGFLLFTFSAIPQHKKPRQKFACLKICDILYILAGRKTPPDT